MKEIRPLTGLASRRIGSQFDGGYVVPIVILEDSKLLVSFGYGNNYDFEKQFLKESTEARCKLFDGSINGKQLLGSFFSFLVLQSPRTGSFPLYQLLYFLRFMRMRMNPRISYYSKFVTSNGFYSTNSIKAIDTFQSELSNTRFILKLDVEGDEYSILESILDYCDHMSCLIVEFHNVDKQVSEFLNLLSKLRKYFFISNVHFNNYAQLEGSIPSTIEMVLTHNHYHAPNLMPAKTIPSDKDAPNKPSKPEIFYTYAT